MADVSRRRQYRSAKRRADAINFLSNISLDGSTQTKTSPHSVSQRQKDDEIDGGLSKKDEETQGTSGRTGPSGCLVSILDETKDTKTWQGQTPPGSGPVSSRLLNAELSSSSRHPVVELSRSMNAGGGSKTSLIASVKNPLGRTRRLSGPAGEKSPPVSPQKVDTNKQRSVSITTSEIPKRKLFQQFSYDPAEARGEHDLQLRAHGLRLRSISQTPESARDNSPTPAKVKMVKSMPKHTADSRPGRVLLISHSYKAPFAIFSHLRYGRDKHGTHRTDSDGNHPISRSRKSSGNKAIRVSSEGYLASLEGVELGDDNRTVSYSHFLVPTRDLSIYRRQMSLEILGSQAPHSPAVRKMQGHPMVNIAASSIQLDRGDSETLSEYVSNLPVYDPNELDDPELSAGKHRKLLTFPSYMVSVVDYTKPSELKKDINQKFKVKYPHIDLSLSKLRSIKRDMRKIILDECSLDALTLAQSYAFYEKLVLMGKINKPNRKLVAGACLVLAAKLNDIKGQDLENLFKELEDTFRESRKDMFGLEFPILVALEFSLHLPEHEVLPHYRRIVQLS